MENKNLDFTVEEQHYAKQIHDLAVEILEEHCLGDDEFMSQSIEHLERMKVLAIDAYQNSGLYLFKRIAEKAEYCKQEYITNQFNKLDLMNTDFMSDAINLMEEILNRTANVFKDYKTAIAISDISERMAYIVSSDYGNKKGCHNVCFGNLDAKRIEAMIDAGLEYLFREPGYGELGVMELYHFVSKYPGFAAKGYFDPENYPERIHIWEIYYDDFASEIDKELYEKLREDFLLICQHGDVVIEDNYMVARWD